VCVTPVIPGRHVARMVDANIACASVREYTLSLDPLRGVQDFLGQRPRRIKYLDPD
jgi:hypothetical protein